MAKLVILGIDALDPILLKRWQDELPVFNTLIKDFYFAELESTMPPDSVPAWVTIYTGKHPWEHGIVDTIDYLDVTAGRPTPEISSIRGKTFWDIASRAGKRVCVINPLLAYPVWQVNGIMVNGPVFITGEAQSYPQEILTKFKLPELGGMVDFPRKKELKAFVERTEKVTRDLARFGLELFQLERWDLYFICFLTLDRLMHFVWRYTDPSDPTYPGHTELEGTIRRAFHLFDSIIRDYINSLSDDQILMIVSDHGHTMRPPRAVFINEILRRHGFLKTRKGRIPLVNTVALIEKSKNAFLRLMQQLDLEDEVYRLARMLPKSKRQSLKTSSYATTRQESLAWVSDLGGGTSFSGIEINRTLCSQMQLNYENLRREIIGLLTPLTDSRGNRLFRWIKPREEVFQGNQVDKYPDIVFELAPGYGVERTLYCGITGTSATHKKVSGGHSKYGVFILRTKDKVALDEKLHITQVFSIIRQILEV